MEESFDLVTLSWCLGEIRESLGQTETLIERHLQGDGEDLSHLRAARASLHQAHGALTVVDVRGVSLVSEEAETLLSLAERGELAFTGDVANRVIASFRAICDYLDDLLHGGPDQPLLLFPYLKAMQESRSAERIHPADLFHPDLSARLAPPVVAAQDVSPEDRAAARLGFEKGLLQFLREPGNPRGVEAMLAAVSTVERSQAASANRDFWRVVEAFFEGIRAGALKPDGYAKRLLARINLQLRHTLEKDAPIADRLMKDTLFSIACSREGVPAVDAVLDAYRLRGSVPADYETPRLARADARALRAAREALNRAKMSWDKVVRGTPAEMPVFGQAVEQFADATASLPGDGLRSLAKILVAARRALSEHGKPASESVSLELATAMLFAEQVLEEGARPGTEHDTRAAEMAQRVRAVMSGKAHHEVPPWLQELSRAAQDRLTMTTFVAELQANLRTVEKDLDAFFRDETQRKELPKALRLLHQVAGALELLGYHDASRGCDAIASRVAGFAESEATPTPPECDRIASSLGALGFFVEGLHQPDRAAGMFSFDEQTGEFSALIGRNVEDAAKAADAAGAPDAVAPAAAQPLDVQPVQASAADVSLAAQTDAPVASQGDGAAVVAATASQAEAAPASVATAAPADAAPEPDPVDPELLDIFLGEAEEVLQAIDENAASSRQAPSDQQYLTTIRRGFHTLKGSSRMVGLMAFGEAGWSMEQVMNLLLSEQRSGVPALYDLIDVARLTMSGWVAELRRDPRAKIDTQRLVAVADTYRETGHADLASIAAPAVAAAAAAAPASLDGRLEIDAAFRDVPTGQRATPTDVAREAANGHARHREAEPEAIDFSFDEPSVPSSPTPAVIQPEGRADASATPADAAAEPAATGLEIAPDFLLDLPPPAEAPVRVADDSERADEAFEPLVIGDPPPIDETSAAIEIPVAGEAGQAADAAVTVDAGSDVDQPEDVRASAEVDAPMAIAGAADVDEPTAIEAPVTIDEPPASDEPLALAEAAAIDEPLSVDEPLVVDAAIPLAGQEASDLPSAIGVDAALDTAAPFASDLPAVPGDTAASHDRGAEPGVASVDLAGLGDEIDAVLAAFAADMADREPRHAAPRAGAVDIGAIDVDALDLAGEADEVPLFAEPLGATNDVVDAVADRQPASSTDDGAPDASDTSDSVRIDGREVSRPLYTIFLGESEELVDALESDCARWRARAAESSSEEALRAAHSLAGSASVVGLQPVHALAERVESALHEQRAVGYPMADGDFEALSVALAALRTMLESFGAGHWPSEQPSALAAMDALLVRMRPVSAAIEPAPSSLVFDDADAIVLAAEPASADDVSESEAAAVAAAPQAFVPGVEVSVAAAALEGTPEPMPIGDDSFDSATLTDLPEYDRITIHDEAVALEIGAHDGEPRDGGLDAADVHHGEEGAHHSDPVDELDPELLPIFIEEASDYLPQIGEDLRGWQAAPSDDARLHKLMRALHTVKGSARMAGAMRLGQRVHEMETRIETLSGLASVPPGLIDELIADYDVVASLFETIRDPSSASAAPVATAASVASPVVADAVRPAAAALGAPLAAQSEVAPVASSASAAGPAADAPVAAPVNASALSSAVPASTPAAPIAAAPAPAAAPAANASPLVRVRADILDKLVNDAGEVSIARSRLDNELTGLRQSLADLTENVNRLRTQLREIEIQAESQIQARNAAHRDHDRNFDPLEFDRFTRFQELTRMLAESVNDVATVQQNATRSLDVATQDLVRQAQVLRDLQQNLMRVRMVQFGSISDRLFRVVRQAAKETDKRVNLDIRGSAVEVDRGVLERMAGPIEHLLRNAVAHGIESRATRVARGKAEAGDIKIEVRQEGNEIVLSFTDDGGGLDLDRIRARAVASKLIQPDAVLSPRELVDLIFAPGFSTATEVTELAGRGVGMDVVRSEAVSLGGRIETETDFGKGTRFTIRLPLTLAVAQVVLVRVGGNRYAVPSSSVEQVLQLKPQPLAAAYAKGHVDWQGSDVPLYYLGTLFELPDATPVAQHYSPVAVLRSGNQRIALHVDEVSRNQEVVVKNVGPQAARVTGVSGATVLGNGEIVLIVNPVAIALASAGDTFGGLMLSPPVIPAAPADMPSTVMVVDDSLTVRKVTQRLLTREGYEVMLAKDGVDALRQLQDRLPDVMLVDIEMPRMDGFDLTRNLRSDERTRSMPVIMITSRTADKHRNYALSLGVDVFLGKPFVEDELLEHIRAFLRARQPRHAIA